MDSYQMKFVQPPIIVCAHQITEYRNSSFYKRFGM